MKAALITRFGGPEVVEIADVPVPVPGAGQVRVRMAWSGVNFSEIYRAAGNYAHSPTYRTTLPMTMGSEGAGRIEAIGSGVSGWSVGDRVCFTRVEASHAERTIVPADRLARVPDAMPLDLAAASITHGVTAHYLSHEYGLERGGSCLVHAGAGGVGQMLIQMARMRGARVLATVGTPEKARIARERGADEAILYREVSFRDEVKRLTDGRGVDIVYDSIGRDTLVDSLNCLRRHGLCVQFGHASGLVENFNTLELAEAGSVFLTRPHLAHYIATPADYARRTGDLMRWLIEGRLQVTIQRRYPLAEAADAMRAIASRQTQGKLLLEIDPGV